MPGPRRGRGEKRRPSLVSGPAAGKKEGSRGVRATLRDLSLVRGGYLMFLRRLLAGFLVLGMAVALALPALGQDKGKDDKGKVEKKEEKKEAKKEEPKKEEKKEEKK